MSNVSVIGAGAFGTALSIYSNKIGHKVKIWSFEKDLPDTVNQTGENKNYLPGIKIPETIQFTSDIEKALENSDLVIFACPSAFLRKTSEIAFKYIPQNAVILSAAKGLENETLYLMSQILTETLPTFSKQIAFISGPSFAREIANNLPTDLTCASINITTAEKIQDLLHSPMFRIYTTTDVIGVELGGALKNIIAVASGVADGLNLGGSARASLMTRGLAEISRLGSAMGANPMTFLGLSGVGDLILTCTGELSRNRTLGKRLAAGEKAIDIINSQSSVAEGYVTVKPVYYLAQKLNIDMPITTAVYKVCYENKDIVEEVKLLMNREKKEEF